MYVTLMSHDNKKDLMVQFCIAYAGVLSQHNLSATFTTGRLVSEATGLPVHQYLSCQHGGTQQIGTRISYNEIDLVLFFVDSQYPSEEEEYISKLCVKNNIPYATNLATAELLVLGMARGDMDWRLVINPKTYITSKRPMIHLSNRSKKRAVNTVDTILIPKLYHLTILLRTYSTKLIRRRGSPHNSFAAVAMKTDDY